MMPAGARVAAFVALLAAIFACAALAGAAIDPGGGGDDAHGAGESADHADRHGTPATPATASPAGVASSQDGYQQHPTQGAGGSWTMRLTLPEAGVYRAFADFKAAGAQHTLGIDLFVPGSFAPKDLPAASRRASGDGYEVALADGHPGELGFLVRRGGKPVTNLQPYLGARGHLVALRDGDLAYQHVHPDATQAPKIAFHTGASEPGTYRLFLQFRHEGRVHTAAFTRVVAP